MAQSRVVRLMQYLLMAAAAFGLVYLFLVMIQPYRFAMTLSEKRGRVIDVQTGEGVPNVDVIVNYEMAWTTPARTGRGCIHQKIVQTDAGGYYVVPDASRDIDVADDLLWRMLPGFSDSYGWVVMYYKDGYAVRDEMERTIDIIEGRPVSSIVTVSPYVKEGAVYVVPPVGMQRWDAGVSPVTADAYIAQTGAVAARMRCFSPDERNSEEYRRLHGEMKASVRRLVCDLPSDKVLAQQAKRFSFDDCASSMGMKRIRERKGEAASLTTGDMCESYRYVPGEYECQGLGGKRPPLKIVTKLDQKPTRSPK